MKRSASGLWVMVLGGALLTASACGGSSGGGDGGTTYETSDLSQLARERSRRQHAVATDAAARPDEAGVTGGASSLGTPSSGGAASATPTDVQAVISASETSNGTAIPQGSGPNGQCPQVLVLLGFWSCPQIGETCSYAAAGVAHSCACDRLNGEGGLPAWVCDQ